MWLVLVFAVGLGLGALLGIASQQLRYFGSTPIEPYEQAVVKDRDGTLRSIPGPAWLTPAERRRLHGVYDVTDKRAFVHVEPVHARLQPKEPGDPTSQRFWMDLVVIYRPVQMHLVLSLGDDLEDWISDVVRSAIREYALTTFWDPLSSGQNYAIAAEQKLQPQALERGIQVIAMFAERVAVRAEGEMASIAKGSNARNLGREGLQLTYLEALRELAKQPSTKILLPTDLAVDAEIGLRSDKA